jgi:flavin-dependent dehydrogenase
MIAYVLKTDSPFCALTVRAELDEFCLNKAIEQGAEFEKISGIDVIRQENDKIVLTTKDGKEFHASYLIGADGCA